jgi:tetratricopeptide (TPR) repeat protein
MFPASGGAGMRRFRFIILVTATVMAPAGAIDALAQPQEQIDACNGKNDASADLRIGGCTALIRTGKYSNKNLSIIFNLRGKAYRDNRDIEAALKDYDQAIRLDPNNAQAYANRGSAFHAKKQYDRALADYAKSLALKPDNATAWAYQGDSYYYAGKPEDAIKSFANAIKYSPDWMWPYNDRGELYLDRDDFELAIKDFDNVVRTSSAYAMGWNNRCRALAIVGRLDQALRDCEEALKINPKFVNHMLKSGNVSAIQHRGLIHLKAGRLGPAIEDFDKALELTKDSAEVLYSRGVAKVKNGDATGGNADIAAAKAIDSGIAEKMAKYGVK